MMTRVLALLAMSAAACSGTGDSLHDIALGLATATATARSASLAMAAIGGTAPSCASVTSACTTYPCAGAVSIAVGGDCAYPLGAAASGTVKVTGQWSSAGSATLGAEFIGVDEAVGKGEAFAATQVTTITATLSGGTVSVTYDGSTATARSGLPSAAVGAASSWMVSEAGVSTTDPSDDVLTVQASSASVAVGLGANVDAVTLSDVMIDPSCAENPVSGTAQVTKVQTIVPSVTNVSFHAACDGKADVNGHPHTFSIAP